MLEPAAVPYHVSGIPLTRFGGRRLRRSGDVAPSLDRQCWTGRVGRGARANQTRGSIIMGNTELQTPSKRIRIVLADWTW